MKQSKIIDTLEMYQYTVKHISVRRVSPRDNLTHVERLVRRPGTGTLSMVNSIANNRLYGVAMSYIANLIANMYSIASC